MMGYRPLASQGSTSAPQAVRGLSDPGYLLPRALRLVGLAIAPARPTNSARRYWERPRVAPGARPARRGTPLGYKVEV